MTKRVYKLLTEVDWNAAQAAGCTSSAVDLADGYVHLSTSAQVKETARRCFSGEGRVKLLRFDPDTLGDIRWEPSRGGDFFPHLYGALMIARVEASWWLLRGADGALVFPENF